MTEIQLTPAELEMITLKREQEELKQKEEDIKRQIQIQKDIAEKENTIAAHIAEDDNQIAAAKAFADKLPGWQLTIKTRPATQTVKQYWNDDAIVWSKEYERRCAEITYKNFTIEVSKHIVYGSSWSSRGTDKGYKMSLLGPDVEWAYRNKMLINPATIIKKVAEIEDTKLAKAILKAKQLNAVDTTIAKLTSEYPDATIVQGTSGSYTGSPNSRNREWVSFPTVTITLANKVKVEYRIYSDGSLGRLNISFPAHKTPFELLTALNGL